MNKNIKQMRIPLAGVVLALLLSLSSCDYLSIDKYLDDELKLDTIFASKRYIEAYMWNAASDFPDDGAIFAGNVYTPGVMATDEAFCLFATSEFQGMGWVLGEYSADNPGSMNRWAALYKTIRKCNTIFARIDEARDWTEREKNTILATTRFLRAYAYYQLITNFGPPIMLGDELVENNEAIEYYNRPRALYDEAMDYICTEFETAARGLELKVSSILDFGLPTSGAALALVARLRLMQASPLFNGGAAAKLYFGTWTRQTDGAHYISQTYHPERWAVAAAACRRVMELKDGGLPLYKLYTVEADDFTPALPKNVTSDPDYYKPFPEGAAGIDPLHSYWDIFNGDAVAAINKEIIWGRSSGTVRDYSRHSFPRNFGGYSGMAVTQKVIDAYEMCDGHTKEAASSDYPYSESGFSGRDTLFSGYTLKQGVYNMYINREPRFYASIGFSGCYWTMSSTTEASYRNQIVNYYFDSPTGKGTDANKRDYTATGYVIRKYINPIDAWAGNNARRIDKPFPTIRYAEILLSYAEALNNIEGSINVTLDGEAQTVAYDAAEIKKAINQVRYRAGLPGLSDAEAADRAYVTAKIKKERMVEFLYENRRFFDVRRWGDYETSESEPIRGMNVDATKDFFFQRTVPTSLRIANRQVNRKFIFQPIPRSEIKRVPMIDQNPGW